MILIFDVNPPPGQKSYRGDVLNQVDIDNLKSKTEITVRFVVFIKYESIG